jgi:hypothetical protein
MGLNREPTMRELQQKLKLFSDVLQQKTKKDQRKFLKNLSPDQQKLIKVPTVSNICSYMHQGQTNKSSAPLPRPLSVYSATNQKCSKHKKHVKEIKTHLKDLKTQHIQ